MSEEITMLLDSPVEYQGKTYTSLTFRKIKAKDLVASDLVDGEVRKSIAIFASNAGVPMGVIEELDLADFERIGEEIRPLLGKLASRLTGQAAGENEAIPTSTL